MEDLRKEKIGARYKRYLQTLKNICRDYDIPEDVYVDKFPSSPKEVKNNGELFVLAQAINSLNRELIDSLCLKEWSRVIVESFDESQQAGTIGLVGATLQCDASNAYERFTRVFALLKMLNDEKQREEALKFLEDYCANNSFEDLVNDYDLVFRSKHAHDASTARNNGFENHKGIGKRKEAKYMHYFNVSERQRRQQQIESAERINQ